MTTVWTSRGPRRLPYMPSLSSRGGFGIATARRSSLALADSRSRALWGTVLRWIAPWLLLSRSGLNAAWGSVRGELIAIIS